MKKAVRNILGGWITTLVGTAAMVISLLLVYKGSITFVWEGIGGLVAGSVLLLAPETIEKKVSEAISALVKKNDNQHYDI
jgi:hypothetical protein